MLQILVPGREFFDEAKSVFITTKDQTLILEHSLISLSKWEAKWHKPFLGKEEKTYEETIDYIRCMTTNQVFDLNVYKNLTSENIQEINTYLENPMTATWFSSSDGGKKSKEVITSELIYYWMVALEIPFECQKWHLNRLLTLIRVCNVKNSPSKKMSKNDIYKQNRALNAARRAKSGGKG